MGGEREQQTNIEKRLTKIGRQADRGRLTGTVCDRPKHKKQRS